MTEAHVHLALVFHQHQPVGNREDVCERVFQRAYEPLLGALERHPGIRAAMHFSGPLLEWFENKPAFLDRLRSLAARQQVELMGGAYYEPVLGAIAEEDRRAQLQKSRDAVEQILGQRPAGAWVPELAWEPGFPRTLNAAGYEWTVLDDTQFGAAGFDPDDLAGWYLTEDSGQTIALFPSSTRLLDLTPWGTGDEWVGFLRNCGDRQPGSLVTLAMDGEKFGGWPGTYGRAWEDGWVESLFARLEAEHGAISTVLPGAWLADHEPQGLAYIPSSGHRDLDAWALPPHLQRGLDRARRILADHGGGLARFARGSHWRHFLVRYPEANLLQKRGLLLAAEARRQGNEQALDHAWRALGSGPMWHGLSGGIYLEHLRDANSRHLALADALLFPGCQPPDIRDWDLDGRDEVCLRSDEHLVIVAPGRGGALTHWELRRPGWHLTHVLARRPEAYHDRMELPVVAFDRGLRLAAQETVLEADATREQYAAARQVEPAEVRHWTLDESGVDLDCQAGDFAYRKQISVDAGLDVAYRARGPGRLFSEWNLSLAPREDSQSPDFALEDGILRITTCSITLIARHDADDLWVEPVITTCQTDGGIEAIRQGWTVVFARELATTIPTTLSVRWSTT